MQKLRSEASKNKSINEPEDVLRRYKRNITVLLKLAENLMVLRVHSFNI